MKDVSIATGNRRLLKLAAFLRKLPDGRFYYNQWVGSDWQGAQDLSCGTTGCAMGWAATMPEFRRLGLYLEMSDGQGYPALKGKDGEEYTALGAAKKLFALDYDGARHLFIPEWSERQATAIEVARKIEKFVMTRS